MERTYETWPIERFKPNPKNARKHSPEQLTQIRVSLREYGWTYPILVDETDLVIAGHGRLEAAKLEGYTSAPVLIASGWTEKQKRAYALADNRIAEQATWDHDILRTEFADLEAMGVDIGVMTGFDSDYVADILHEGQKYNDPEAAPEPPKNPVSRLGDLWVLGDHRVLAGDATNAADVARLLGTARPNLMCTDPPYGVNYDANWRNNALRSDGTPSDGRAVGQVSNDDRVDWRLAWNLFPGSVAYCWHADRHASEVQCSLEDVGFEIRCQIIWAKPRFVIGRGDYHWMHEPLWYAVRKGAKSNWQGDRTQTTLWEISHTKSETGHSTQKPLDCMRRPIVNNSTPGEAVYDPFLGSGTTVIAAELERRRCYGLEIDPAYVDVIVERWQNYTGKIATLEDGTPFEAVRAQRRAGQAIPEASIPPTSGPPAEPVETAMPFEPIPAEAMP